MTISDDYGNKRVPVYKGDRIESKKILHDFLDTKLLIDKNKYFLVYQVEVTIKSLKQYDILFTSAYLELYSPKAISILEKICPEQIQAFDTTIEYKDGNISDYKAINFLNEVDVSDPQLRTFRYLTDNKTIAGYDWGGFVIRNQSMEPIHIGREKHSHATIIISATLKEAFEKAKIKGCQYWPGDKP